MTPDFVLTPPEPKKPHKLVRDTSVMGRDVVKETCDGRTVEVLRWLSGYWNRHQESPTAAEVTRWAERHDTNLVFLGRDPTDRVLYVRRGLSDLQAKRVVEAAGARHCTVTGRKVETWRVVERGT